MSKLPIYFFQFRKSQVDSEADSQAVIFPDLSCSFIGPLIEEESIL